MKLYIRSDYNTKSVEVNEYISADKSNSSSEERQFYKKILQQIKEYLKSTYISKFPVKNLEWRFRGELDLDSEDNVDFLRVGANPKLDWWKYRFNDESATFLDMGVYIDKATNKITSIYLKVPEHNMHLRGHIQDASRSLDVDVSNLQLLPDLSDTVMKEVYEFYETSKKRHHF